MRDDSTEQEEQLHFDVANTRLDPFVLADCTRLQNEVLKRVHSQYVKEKAKNR